MSTDPRDDTALWADLRTVLARLELVSSAPITAYNPGGHAAPGSGEPPGDNKTAADHYRHRLQDIKHTEQRKHEQALDAHALALARSWAHDQRRRVLRDARDELEQLTGRTDAPPKPRAAVLDDPGKLAELVLTDGEGHPPDVVAVRFRLSEHMVRRIRSRAMNGDEPAPRDPETGHLVVPEVVPAGDERRRRARAMAEQGMTERQIAFRLGCDRNRVRRDLGRAA